MTTLPKDKNAPPSQQGLKFSIIQQGNILPINVVQAVLLYASVLIVLANDTTQTVPIYERHYLPYEVLHLENGLQIGCNDYASISKIPAPLILSHITINDSSSKITLITLQYTEINFLCFITTGLTTFVNCARDNTKQIKLESYMPKECPLLYSSEYLITVFILMHTSQITNYLNNHSTNIVNLKHIAYNTKKHSMIAYKKLSILKSKDNIDVITKYMIEMNNSINFYYIYTKVQFDVIVVAPNTHKKLNSLVRLAGVKSNVDSQKNGDAGISVFSQPGDENKDGTNDNKNSSSIGVGITWYSANGITWYRNDEYEYKILKASIDSLHLDTKLLQFINHQIISEIDEENNIYNNDVNLSQINKMLLWICSLENKWFNKYKEILSCYFNAKEMDEETSHIFLDTENSIN